MNQQQSICSQAREKTRAKRAATQVFSFLTLRAAAFVNCAALVIACVFLFVNGIGALNIDFVLDSPREMMTSGGVFPCLVGTFLLAAGAIAIALPFGVACAVWLNEYGKQGPVVDIVRLSVANLAGVPSIVFGLFGMALFVNTLGFGDSIIAGSLTLGLLVLPIVIRTTEEAFKDIPDSYREGSLALGATKVQTIWKVLLPMAMPRIITGLILSLGRVSGETAPILFTCAAYFLPRLPEGIFDQCMALPYHLYVVATSGTDIEAQMPIAYGTAFVLILIVLFMNLLANGIRKYFENKLKQK